MSPLHRGGGSGRPPRPIGTPFNPAGLAAGVAEPVARSLEAGVLTLTLDRAEKKNALDLATLGLLAQHLAAAGGDPKVRAVVLAARGDAFSAGGDIQVMREHAGDAQAALARLRGGLNRVVALLHGLPKPVLAQVEGNAYGAGAILAFQCDLPIVAEDAAFSLSFRHVGLIPDTGGTWLLPRAVGLPRAKHLAWTAAPFTGADAARWGLALEAVPRGQVPAKVRALAQALADGPASAIALSKQAFHRNLGVPLDEALDREARLQAAAFLAPEHAEGRDAFFARRKPAFR
jgi:2-(1,2-epoxy-1,2-dihydrophenyl)acetyl-CoA isomerase